MASGFVIRKNKYYDSVFLMGVNKRLSQREGVLRTAVLMGSENNKRLLAEIGISGDEIDKAEPNDLIVAVIAENFAIVETILSEVDQALLSLGESIPVSSIHTFEDGMSSLPYANLAVLTIPGEYVYRESKKVLEAGLNLFIFSSNVPIEQEHELKQIAAKNDLLVMGPDCGTSILGGVGIGFANRVRRGEIGAIGPSGTGLQEFTTQIHHAGLGISQAIGTGSNDLSDEIGGMTTIRALNALESDPQTKVIAIIAKPPDKAALKNLITRANECTKPVVGCFIGAQMDNAERADGLLWANTIDHAVHLSIQQLDENWGNSDSALTKEELEIAEKSRNAWTNEQKYLRGLFAGGTFCYQSQYILREAGIFINSNSPLDPQFKLPHPEQSIDHTLIDMGDEVYTLGKPHPMIDSSVRAQRIRSESRDPSVAILLLDIILGFNASSDPVGDVLDAILEAKQIKRESDGELTVVASMCGTEGDPQEMDLQIKMLREANVIVFNSNARATLFCRELLRPN